MDLGLITDEESNKGASSKPWWGICKCTWEWCWDYTDNYLSAVKYTVTSRSAKSINAVYTQSMIEKGNHAWEVYILLSACERLVRDCWILLYPLRWTQRALRKLNALGYVCLELRGSFSCEIYASVSCSELGWLLKQIIHVNVILKQISICLWVGSGAQLD